MWIRCPSSGHGASLRALVLAAGGWRCKAGAVRSVRIQRGLCGSWHRDALGASGHRLRVVTLRVVQGVRRLVRGLALQPTDYLLPHEIGRPARALFVMQAERKTR